MSLCADTLEQLREIEGVRGRQTLGDVERLVRQDGVEIGKRDYLGNP